MYLVLKTLITTVLIVSVSEISKRYPHLGALIISLPFLSIMAMVWMYFETQDHKLLASHSMSTFFYVLPSLPMFVLVAILLRKGLAFSTSMILGSLLTIVLYVAMVMTLKSFDIQLL